MAEILTNWETGGIEEQALGISGANNYVHSQSFQIQKDAIIDKIEIWIKDGPTAPTDNITIRIETDSAGVPSGTLAHANGTGTMLQSAIDGTFAWVEQTFTPFVLVKDTVYHLKITIPTQTGDSRNHMLAQQPTPGYTYGNLCVSTDAGSSWLIKTTHDLIFRVYGNPEVLGVQGAMRGNKYWGETL